jgi:RNA-directed DNA polymerase
MSSTVNTGFIPDMQRKLYRWSNADPEKGFADLFNLVCDYRTLVTAWMKLARNKGSQTPGTDGVTHNKVEKRPGGVASFLEEIRGELRRGTYRPEPVRQRLIPKPGKPGKVRPLGIPTLKDRLVQMALKLVLEPIFEADFYPTSYGFRRGRSTHDALAKIQRQLHSDAGGYRYVIEGDIKGCFDAIDHHLLMERVRRRIKDSKVLRLVLAFLKAGILAEGTVRHPITGTPQGGIISPTLANIYLTAIDERYGRWSLRPRERPQNAADRRHYDRKRGRPTFPMVRYADDFVVLVAGTREEAEAEKQALAEFLQKELRMELSIEKTKITEVEVGFDFLGYRIAQTKARRTGRPVGNLFIPKSKLTDLCRRIKVKVRETPTGYPLASLIGKLNPILTGWRNYYRYATWACHDFAKLDWAIRQRIGRWLRKKHRKATWRELRRRFSGTTYGNRLRWCDGTTRLRFLREGGTSRFPYRGIRIPNGWNADPDEQFLAGAGQFWSAFNTLATA